MKWAFLFAAALCLLVAVTAAKPSKSSINPDLINAKVERTVDVASQLVKISTLVTLENGGKSSAGSFVVALDSSLIDNLAFLGATTGSGDEQSTLSMAETAVEGRPEGTCYSVTLDSALAGGASVDVSIETVFTHILRPYPAKITQSEKQFVEFTGNAYFLSPYTTKTQTTKVVISSSNVESYSKVNPVSQNEDIITYGPYEDTAPMSEAELKVHYENNSPFLTVTTMTRVIEVSHWGNIAVEETVDVSHTGAVLKGPFSRYDYQRTQDGFSSVKSYKTILPAAARDIYYRDEIGNISTSNMVEHDDYVELELRPRFPLFGGWKTHYYIGYNLPSYEYLYTSGDNYILKMRFLDHIYDNMNVDEVVLKIILPEGSKNIDLVTPYPVKRSADEKHFTYLDTIGRPVVTASKNKLVEQHIIDFELHYSFQKLLLLQEPLLVVGTFYLLFVTIIVLVRLDFSISKDEVSESRMKVAGLVEEVASQQAKRARLTKRYEEAIFKYKSNKDANAFRATLKKIEGEHRSATDAIKDLIATISKENADVADKMNEVQKLSRQHKELIQAAITNAEKVMSGKFSKNQYVDIDKATTAKRSELETKIESLLGNL
ncbi:dolichyl-diphosphooligosaccharide--protein glycosyltransferase subunit 1 [Strongylocentrotus purpuratus]|uniref:Dolichyl-diphosphooligosaccharide--protein glycosyltransferase subunit 1 n=1 Tax=Strongylocentrotus purpuratus TaxID=7668 RepID=A0A7M7PTY1_STRPU|nr:dolichyl-diphosphooligosaccharide--protein glycosyltransferase subunit 1 [Strongylocentrotus purpuratus]